MPGPAMPLWLLFWRARRASGFGVFPRSEALFFLPLGRAIRLGEPVAVVTTSGTAAAELLPAAIEAHYQAIPLVLITAAL